jgi:hypothetical protein
MPYERTIEISVVEGVIVRLSQSGTPIDRYSVILLAFVDGTWETIRATTITWGRITCTATLGKAESSQKHRFTKVQRTRRFQQQLPISKPIGKR